MITSHLKSIVKKEFFNTQRFIETCWRISKLSLSTLWTSSSSPSWKSTTHSTNSRNTRWRKSGRHTGCSALNMYIQIFNLHHRHHHQHTQTHIGTHKACHDRGWNFAAKVCTWILASASSLEKSPFQLAVFISRPSSCVLSNSTAHRDRANRQPDLPKQFQIFESLYWIIHLVVADLAMLHFRQAKQIRMPSMPWTTMHSRT